MIFLSLVRLFSYIAVILISAFFFKETKRKYILVGNIIVSSGLMCSVVSSLFFLEPAHVDWVFIVINLSVFLWAVLHIIQFSKR